MTTWGERVAAPILAATAAAWWGYALVVLQPRLEAELAGLASVGNNAYWAREARWSMILLVLVAVVWSCRGDRVRSAIGTAGALAWIGVDTWLDRIDLAAPTWQVTVPAGVAAAACIAAAIGRPHHDRTVLVPAASVAASSAAFVGAIQSPTDTEPGLLWSGYLGAGLSIALTLGCAASAAPGRPGQRAVAAAALVVCAALVFLMWRSFPGEPAAGWAAPPLAIILLWTVLIRVWTPPGGLLGHALALPAVAVATLIAGCLLVPLVILNLGAPFTALAGNPPVNGADSDTLNSALSVLVGLAAGTSFNLLASRSPRTPAGAFEPA
ncbi:hypothetical protein [Glycomyces rhizosphaerae]|uniref:Uncharacterized protein n=1 Tax=Glycomyces rhizosphaerae TaxID=2054422 RepID=A0ABV7PUN0_9ACTN